MEIVNRIFNKINLSKPKINFLKLLIPAMIGSIGKRTFRNMARYVGMEEHRFARQMDKDVDFPNINLEIIHECKKPSGKQFAETDQEVEEKGQSSNNTVNSFEN